MGERCLLSENNGNSCSQYCIRLRSGYLRDVLRRRVEAAIPAASAAARWTLSTTATQHLSGCSALNTLRYTLPSLLAACLGNACVPSNPTSLTHPTSSPVGRPPSYPSHTRMLHSFVLHTSSACAACHLYSESEPLGSRFKVRVDEIIIHPGCLPEP